MLLYIALSELGVSAALAREEERIQRLVYFVSKGLNEVETRYPKLEKLACALLIASRKLRPYF